LLEKGEEIKRQNEQRAEEERRKYEPARLPRNNASSSKRPAGQQPIDAEFAAAAASYRAMMASRRSKK